MTLRRMSILGLAMVLLCSLASPAMAEFSLNGYLQSQFGVFVSQHSNKTELDEDGKEFPTDHGDMYGLPSMFRNTLQLEADYSPTDNINLHVVFRGVRSAALEADRYAQVPVFDADDSYNKDISVMRAKKNWVQDTYYTEADFREIFLDIEAANWLSFRLGRQQASWGDTGSFRLLDVVNPENTTWHFGAFEQFEDTRIPLWMMKTLVDIPPMRGNLELLWIPLIDEPENTVTTPLTFVGAWGLPLAPRPEFKSKLVIEKKEMVYPKDDLTDSRMGVRWNGTAGPLTYTMVYFYTHSISPPIPTYVEKNPQADPETGKSDTRVYLTFPRQHVFGGSLDYAIPRPVSTVVKLEVAAYPRQPYPVNSYLDPGRFPDSIRDWYPSPDNASDAVNGDSDYRIRNDIYFEERDTINWAMVLFRPSQIRWLNPTSSIIMQAQVFQSLLLEPNEIEETLPDGSKQVNDNWYMVSIPGFDTTRVRQYNNLYVFAALTSYFHGLFNPTVIVVVAPGGDDDYLGAWDIDKDTWSGLVSTQFKFVLGNHWRLETGYNAIWGADPYINLGLFRDRDEVYGKVVFQF